MAVSLIIREKAYRQKTSILSFLGKIWHVAIILLLIFGGVHLKLSGVLCLQKVRQMVFAHGYKQLGPGDNQTSLKVAVEKFCSTTRGYDDAQSQQKAVTEDIPSPLSAPQE